MVDLAAALGLPRSTLRRRRIIPDRSGGVEGEAVAPAVPVGIQRGRRVAALAGVDDFDVEAVQVAHVGTSAEVIHEIPRTGTNRAVRAVAPGCEAVIATDEGVGRGGIPGVLQGAGPRKHQTAETRAATAEEAVCDGTLSGGGHWTRDLRAHLVLAGDVEHLRQTEGALVHDPAVDERVLRGRNLRRRSRVGLARLDPCRIAARGGHYEAVGRPRGASREASEERTERSNLEKSLQHWSLRAV